MEGVLYTHTVLTEDRQNVKYSAVGTGDEILVVGPLQNLRLRSVQVMKAVRTVLRRCKDDLK